MTKEEMVEVLGKLRNQMLNVSHKELDSFLEQGISRDEAFSMIIQAHMTVAATIIANQLQSVTDGKKVYAELEDGFQEVTKNVIGRFCPTLRIDL